MPACNVHHTSCTARQSAKPHIAATNPLPETAHIVTNGIMFQTFDASADPSRAHARISRLRDLMDKAKINAYIVPRADEHQGEYVPACAERLHWLTGFSGSAGMAAIGTQNAAVFVDGRYTVQARGEIDTALMSIEALKPGALATWLTGTLNEGAIIGFDPALFTIRQVRDLKKKLAEQNQKLKPIKANLVDKAWGADRPPPPLEPTRLHPTKFAGKDAADKIAELRTLLTTDDQDAVVLTLPDSIAWLFNIRGGDIPHTPVALAFAIVHQRAKPELFIESAKLDKTTRATLKSVAKLRKPEDLDAALKDLRDAGKTVRIDPATAGYRFEQRLGGKTLAFGTDPCIALKAVKNTTEIDGARNAHIRDGVAVVSFLHWLDTATSKGSVDEIEAVRQLEGFRAATGDLREISFDTISGSGPNGAIVHYRVSEASNRALKAGELFLIDSGAQYADGTTDITRTIAIGKPTSDMIRNTTLVLKGHIGVATALFPKGTRGVDLDPFARRALWADGLDYDHGTGHGVGSYLSVHEGPASISRAGMVAFKPGMILSNEPGYYCEGAYGIRLENLVLVKDVTKDVPGDRTTYGFETLTLAPFDRALIDADLLNDEECNWLNAYHARVLKTLSPFVKNTTTKAWLKSACAPL